MMPIIRIKHNSKGYEGSFWALVDWWNIYFTNKYKNLDNNAKMYYILFHQVLESRVNTFHRKMIYAQLTKILKMNNALK